MQKDEEENTVDADELTPVATLASPTTTTTTTTLGRAYREAVSSVIATAVSHAFRIREEEEAHKSDRNTESAPHAPSLGVDALACMVSPLASQRLQLVRPLGRGAYGSVYLMRSLLDGRLEAVKQIPFVSEVPPWATTSFHDDAVREVRALAACQESPYIVRYYHSWTEPDWVALRCLVYDEDNNLMKFCAPQQPQQPQQPQSLRRSLQTHQGRRKDMWPHVLYISMEPVFGVTLETWLHDRNERFFSDHKAATSSFSFGSAECVMLQQMAEGLAHVHEQGIIHRDLKPSNIFVVASPQQSTKTSVRVKLADFGLASVTGAIRLEEQFGNPRAMTNGSNDHDDKNDTARILLTAGVGTPTYSAPETLFVSSTMTEEGTSIGEATGATEALGVPAAAVAYGPEADVYSMGLITLELMTPFATYMERARVLCDARETGEIPRKKEMVEAGVPTGFVTLLASMIDRSPACRPSARSVADTLRHIFFAFVDACSSCSFLPLPCPYSDVEEDAKTNREAHLLQLLREKDEELRVCMTSMRTMISQKQQREENKSALPRRRHTF